MLPPGLTYHLGYSVLAAITMALLVKFAWPADFDEIIDAIAEIAADPKDSALLTRQRISPQEFSATRSSRCPR